MITEAEKLENGDYEMFGYCHLGDDEMAELGYVRLSELEELQLPFGLKIERDLYMPDDCDLIHAMKTTGITLPAYILKDYEKSESNYSEIILSKVTNYFKENKIENLMNYGNDYDEGLLHLSSLYKNLLDELNINYLNIYTEDISDGKYLTTITFEDNSQINLETSAFNGIDVVTENIKSIYEYVNTINKENEIDCEY